MRSSSRNAMQKQRDVFYKGLITFGSLVVVIALFEGLVSYLMLSGLQRASPEIILTYFRGYYWDSVYRHPIQFDPTCSVYDREVFYRLRPRGCLHTGLRFGNFFSINNLGVRDDEESLAAPEIISIGDSHAMGWGVDQQDTYAQIIERQTGMRALNMGIASFGTVREMMLLNRADLSGLKYLIIQYDDNDLEENQKYLKNGCRLQTSSRQEWEYLAEQEKANKRYYPGAHFAGLMRSAFRLLKRNVGGRLRQNIVYDANEHATDFLAVLASFDRPELQKARIIVFDVRNEIHRGNPAETTFSKALASLEASENFKKFASRITVLDLASDLNGASYRHIVDNHINEDGHRLIARAVLEHIKYEK